MSEQSAGRVVRRSRPPSSREARSHPARAGDALLAVSRAVRSRLEPSEVARRATRGVVRALGADLGSAWRITAAGDRLVPIAGYHVPRDLDQSSVTSPVIADHPIVDTIVAGAGPVYAADSQRDPRFDYPLLRLIPHKSVLVQPLRVGRTFIGIFAIVWIRASHRFHSQELRLVKLVAQQTAAAVERAALFAEVRSLNERLERLVEKRTLALERADQVLRASRDEQRAFARHLEKIREAEQTRIAREIHDELGQALTGLKMDLWRMASVKPTVQAGGPDDILPAVDGIIHSVRRIATELRPSVLDDLGLTAALESQIRDFEKRTGIRPDLFCSGAEPNLDSERTTAIFRIFQEALTNVARHADATAVTVTLSVHRRSLLLEIRDNGRGMPASVRPYRRHLGLLGMQERAAAFGGRVTVRSKPGQGTTVRVRLPLARKF